MSTHLSRSPRRRRRRRNALASTRTQAALGLGVLLCAGTLATHAYWTDAVTVTGSSFSTGTIDLQVNNADSAADFSTVNLSGMVPGSTTAGVLTVKDNGTAALKYTATATATNADGKNLAAALVVKVTADTAVTGTGSARTCAGTALAGTGTALTGNLVSTGRLLAAGASEKLCVQVTLPATAASALQGATTTATLTFNGTSDLS
jgi:predicted ribosomally synthesized peptide with SipW-like signal peptide